MIVTCPSCKSKFRLEDGLVKSPYQKMRCSQCKHVFVYEQDFGGKQGDQMPPAPPVVEEGTGRRNGRRKVVVLAVSLGVLVVLALSFYVYWVNHLGAGDRWLRIQKMEGQETVLKDGWAFVIRGTVVNGSTKARKYLIVKAKLFDARGIVLGEHRTLAGLSFSKDEIQQMNMSEIQKRITDFKLSDVGVFVLHKNRELPFSIVFPEAYSGKTKEFSVEIVESPFL
jgi:predicted Zn finger-like uncharacterized protein